MGSAVNEGQEVQVRDAWLKLAYVIRRERRDREWTQGTLAAKVGMTGQQISKLETGEHPPNFATIYRVCQVLGLKVSILPVGPGDSQP